MVSPPINAERWLELMRRDKKVERGAMRFVVLRCLGEAFIQTIDERDAADVVADHR
jgi:3-dehydroquinate synthase